MATADSVRLITIFLHLNSTEIKWLLTRLDKPFEDKEEEKIRTLIITTLSLGKATLELTKKQAEWLKGFTQNPLDEIELDKEQKSRTDIWNALHNEYINVP